MNPRVRSLLSIRSSLWLCVTWVHWLWRLWVPWSSLSLSAHSLFILVLRSVALGAERERQGRPEPTPSLTVERRTTTERQGQAPFWRLACARKVPPCKSNELKIVRINHFGRETNTSQSMSESQDYSCARVRCSYVVLFSSAQSSIPSHSPYNISLFHLFLQKVELMKNIFPPQKT